jgi:hypothetical protein
VFIKVSSLELHDLEWCTDAAAALLSGRSVVPPATAEARAALLERIDRLGDQLADFGQTAKAIEEGERRREAVVKLAPARA